MKTVQTSTEMSQAGSLISFKNLDGQDVAPRHVLYTVYGSTGKAISGTRLPAFSVKFSEYSISWIIPPNPGLFRIEWYYGTDDAEESSVSYLYSYDVSLGLKANSDLKIYPHCYTTSGYDFYIKFTDDSGQLQDVYEIKWYIANLNGCLQTIREDPNRIGTGEYNVATQLCYSKKDYYLVWEYQETSESPLSRLTMRFTLV